MKIQLPLILDGATGTELQKYGYTLDQCVEQWALEHSEAVVQIQKDYVSAGSQVVYAPTFGANRSRLEHYGLQDQVEDYNIRLMELSRRAADGRAMVAGNLSPTGKFVAPMGDASFEELSDIYREQVSAIEKAGADLYAIETMITLEDARASVLAVKELSSKPVFVTFTCDEAGKLISGMDAIEALLTIQEMGVDAIGLNCSVGPANMLTQLKRLSGHAQVPLIAKPNAGLPKMIGGKPVYSCSPEEFASLVPEMAAAGVAIFGGCCGTEPAHIRALALEVEKWSGRQES